MVLFEFTVEGPPLSHQTRDKKKLRAWKAKVRRAARAFWHGPPLAIPVKISVAYYHEGPAVSIDNDNLIKPIQDALIDLIYTDDQWITDTIVQIDRAPEHQTTL